MIDRYSPSTDEEATGGALYFGRILARLGVDYFPSFPVVIWLFPT